MNSGTDPQGNDNRRWNPTAVVNIAGATNPLLASGVRLALLCCVWMPAIGCNPDSQNEQAGEMTLSLREPRATPGYVVDSLFPMAEELIRFKASVGPEPAALDSPFNSIPELAQEFIDGVSRGDTLGLRRLHLSREEFAYLYFPFSEFAKPPYELPPALAWGQLTTASNQGIRKLMKLFGNGKVGLMGVACEDSPRAEGENRLWQNCVTRWRDARKAEHSARLFGAILEREGRMKFVSFANDF